MAFAAGSQEHHKVFLGWKHCSRQQGACKRTHGHYFRTNCSGTAFGLGGGRRGEQQDRWENASLRLRTRVILFSVGITSGVLIAIPFLSSQLLFNFIQQKILTELRGNRSRLRSQNFSLSQRRRSQVLLLCTQICIRLAGINQDQTFLMTVYRNNL